MSAMKLVLKEAIKSVMKDYRAEGERVYKAKFLSLLLEALQGVRRLYLMAIVGLIGAILFALSLFQWIRNSVMVDSEYIVFDWRSTFTDFFFWFALATLVGLIVALREKSWLQLFGVNRQINRIYGLAPLRHAADQSVSRFAPSAVDRSDYSEKATITSVDELAEMQREIYQNELDRKVGH